jgi:hypothetical protein
MEAWLSDIILEGTDPGTIFARFGLIWLSLTYVRGFCVKFFFQPIYTDYTNYAYFDKTSHLCLYSSNLDTFWLKIKQFWPFEEISIFSNGSHLGWRWEIPIKIFLSETICSIRTKF